MQYIFINICKNNKRMVKSYKHFWKCENSISFHKTREISRFFLLFLPYFCKNFQQLSLTFSTNFIFLIIFFFHAFNDFKDNFKNSYEIFYNFHISVFTIFIRMFFNILTILAVFSTIFIIFLSFFHILSNFF